MAGLYHFLPHLTLDRLSDGPLPAVLAARELAGVLADCPGVPEPLLARQVAAGPDGWPGLLLYPKPPHRRVPSLLDYDPQRQQFLAGPPGPRPGDPPLRYVGWERGAWPTPEDLARTAQVEGHGVQDSLGRVWQVPVARSLRSSTGHLPCDYLWVGGQPQARLKRQYAALWERAGRLWDGLGDPARAVTVAEGLETAALALGVNYRLGPLELTALAEAGCPLLDTDTVRHVWQALVDWPTLLAEMQAGEKKTTPAA